MASKVMPNLITSNKLVYLDDRSITSYTIPIKKLKIRKNYGVALVGAWKDLFLIFYISDASNSDVYITKIAGFDNNHNATISTDGTNITINFNYTPWYGISILPL